jgi:hypothetical protein
MVKEFWVWGSQCILLMAKSPVAVCHVTRNRPAHDFPPCSGRLSCLQGQAWTSWAFGSWASRAERPAWDSGFARDSRSAGASWSQRLPRGAWAGWPGRDARCAGAAGGERSARERCCREQVGGGGGEGEGGRGAGGYIIAGRGADLVEGWKLGCVPCSDGAMRRARGERVAVRHLRATSRGQGRVQAPQCCRAYL